jgi:hypothetical protein
MCEIVLGAQHAPWWTSPVWQTVAAIGQLLAALVAGLAAWYAKRSASAAGESAKEAGRTADLMEANIRISQRAWVGVESIDTEPKLNPGVKPVYRIILRNTGSSPALKAKLYMHIILTDQRLTEADMRRLDVEAQEMSLSIAPGMQCRTAGTLPPDRTISNGELTRLREGSIFLYGFGGIKYEDIFGESHVSEWAFRYDSKQLGEITIFPFHNDMT